MKKYKVILLIAGYISAFILGGFAYSIVAKVHMVDAGNVFTEESSERFQRLTEKLAEDFRRANYEEVVKGSNNLLTVPDSILGPQQEDIATSIFGRQKNYIYKNKADGTIVLLSISTRLGPQHPQWQHSICYSDARYNSPENDLREYYSSMFPAINVYQYGFEKNGYSINSTFLSHADFHEGSNPFVDFITQLDSFLDESL
ncbi:hypothetical protein NST37_06065 [Brevibacillus sp. FSL K6-6036]|uniref:hypothetical protein n=1 Tax=Brevibacillus sp. FSL K6-6036 TaxID=2954682 RepID=UPI0030CCE4FA